MCQKKKEKKKEGASGFASIRDSVDASIQRLYYIKKRGRWLITATRNNTDNTNINRTKITRKQKKFKKIAFPQRKPNIIHASFPFFSSCQLSRKPLHVFENVKKKQKTNKQKKRQKTKQKTKINKIKYRKQTSQSIFRSKIQKLNSATGNYIQFATLLIHLILW